MLNAFCTAIVLIYCALGADSSNHESSAHVPRIVKFTYFLNYAITTPGDEQLKSARPFYLIVSDKIDHTTSKPSTGKHVCLYQQPSLTRLILIFQTF